MKCEGGNNWKISIALAYKIFIYTISVICILLKKLDIKFTNIFTTIFSSDSLASNTQYKNRIENFNFFKRRFFRKDPK
jgi:hypothetical protein